MDLLALPDVVPPRPEEMTPMQWRASKRHREAYAAGVVAERARAASRGAPRAETADVLGAHGD